MSVSWLAAPTDFLVVICREILPTDCSRKYFLCAPDEMLCSLCLCRRNMDRQRHLERSTSDPGGIKEDSKELSPEALLMRSTEARFDRLTDVLTG